MVPTRSSRAGFSGHRFTAKAGSAGNFAPLVADVVARLEQNQPYPDFQGEVYAEEDEEEIQQANEDIALFMIDVGLSFEDFGDMITPANQLVGFMLGASGLTTDPQEEDTLIILDALQVIASILVDISEEIAALQKQIEVEFTESEYLSTASSLNGARAQIQTAYETFSIATSGNSTVDPVTLQNVTAPQMISLTTSLTEIGQVLVGDSNNEGLTFLSRDLCGATTPFGRQAPVERLFNHVATYNSLVSRASHLIVNGYHAANPLDYTSATVWFDQACQQIAQQNALLPYVPDNDKVIIDRANGRIWYMDAVEKSAQESQQTGWLYSAGHPYTGWRLASSSDLETLIANRQDSDFSDGGFSNFTRDNYYGTSDRATFDPATYDSNNFWSSSDKIKVPCMYCCDLTAQTDPRLRNLKSIAIQGSPPSLKAIGTFTTPGVADVEVDITDQVVWDCDLPLTARLQNAPSVVATTNTTAGNTTSAAGLLTWWGNGTVTVTASRISDLSGANISTSRTFTQTAAPVPAVTAMTVSPYGVTLNSLTPIRINAVAAFANGQGADVSTNVTWQTSIPEAVVNITNVAQLTLTARPTAISFLVNATYNGQTSSQKFYVNF
jgi:hypothetical protein